MAALFKAILSVLRIKRTGRQANLIPNRRAQLASGSINASVQGILPDLSALDGPSQLSEQRRISLSKQRCDALARLVPGTTSAETADISKRFQSIAEQSYRLRNAAKSCANR